MVAALLAGSLAGWPYSSWTCFRWDREWLCRACRIEDVQLKVPRSFMEEQGEDVSDAVSPVVRFAVDKRDMGSKILSSVLCVLRR